MKLIKYFHIYFISFTLLSCSSNSDNDEPIIVSPPTAARLLTPINNEVCLTGVSINELQSSVMFSWQTSQHTTNYDLLIKNITTNEETTYNSTSINKEITLTKGEPYSWQIISKSNQTGETSQSETWKFYLASNGIINYAPFPASAIHPLSNSIIEASSGETYLEWSAYDVDNDIESYDVYLDNINGKSTLLSSNISDTKIEAIDILPNETYYWSVITKDNNGNISDSKIFTFKTE